MFSRVDGLLWLEAKISKQQYATAGLYLACKNYSRESKKVRR